MTKTRDWSEDEIDRITEYLSVDPDSKTGLSWKRKMGRAKKGSASGSLARNGYYRTMIFGRYWSNHRLVLLLSGIDPPDPSYEADHIDRDKTNNKLTNLRWTTKSINCSRTKESSNRTGLRYVYQQSGAKTFTYQFKLGGRTHYAGRFKTPTEAHLAALARRLELHWPQFMKP